MSAAQSSSNCTRCLERLIDNLLVLRRIRPAGPCLFWEQIDRIKVAKILARLDVGRRVDGHAMDLIVVLIRVDSTFSATARSHASGARCWA